MSFLDFDALQGRLFQLYNVGAFADALALIARERDTFPAYAHHSYYWLICLAAIQGKPDEALDWFDQALARGYWFSQAMLRSDPDLKSLQGQPGFEACVSECVRRAQAASATGTPQRVVTVPPPEFAPPYPLLMCLHGMGGYAEETAARWRSAADEGWLVAAPQSSQPSGYGRWEWTDEDKAMPMIRNCASGSTRTLTFNVRLSNTA